MSEQPKKPRLFVDPAPNGVHPELMDIDAAFEYVREWITYASHREVIELEVRLMTDEEVEALPDV